MLEIQQTAGDAIAVIIHDNIDLGLNDDRWVAGLEERAAKATTHCMICVLWSSGSMNVVNLVGVANMHILAVLEFVRGPHACQHP
jgi:hypothetical protein